jgi:hypothetical protein
VDNEKTSLFVFEPFTQEEYDSYIDAMQRAVLKNKPLSIERVVPSDLDLALSGAEKIKFVYDTEKLISYED